MLRAWLIGRYRLVTSEHILIELRRTLAKPYFAARLPVGQAETIVRLLRDLAQLVTPAASVVGGAAYPEDDVVLATALSGTAG